MILGSSNQLDNMKSWSLRRGFGHADGSRQHIGTSSTSDSIVADLYFLVPMLARKILNQFTDNVARLACLRPIFNCTLCQRDVSDEWSERRWGQSDAPSVPNLQSCPFRKFSKKFFTIGYDGAAPKALVGILKENGVKVVVDVRLWPHRASMGSYVLAKSPDKGIQHLLAKDAIQYHSFLELGNAFFQFADWRQRYRQLLSSSGELLTERLLEISEPCCLLCAKKQPADCHRSIIGDFLSERGHAVEHLIAPATGQSLETQSESY